MKNTKLDIAILVAVFGIIVFTIVAFAQETVAWTDETSVMRVADYEESRLTDAVLEVCSQEQIDQIEAILFPDAKALTEGAYASQKAMDAVRAEFDEGPEVEAEKARIVKRQERLDAAKE